MSHILITGGAGMIGRKLTERLVSAGALNGKPIERLTLLDVIAPSQPAGFAGKIDTVIAVRIGDGRITGLYAVRNPAKLSHMEQETTLRR